MLMVRGFEITSITFKHLVNLTELDLSNNLMNSLDPEVFSFLSRFETLDLSGNESITDLDSEFIGVENWVEILLADKNFATLNRYWYKTL